MTPHNAVASVGVCGRDGSVRLCELHEYDQVALQKSFIKIQACCSHVKRTGYVVTLPSGLVTSKIPQTSQRQ